MNIFKEELRVQDPDIKLEISELKIENN